MKRLTQKDRILLWIADNGSITSWDAYKELGITQSKERIISKNRYGYPTHYDIYRLED